MNPTREVIQGRRPRRAFLIDINRDAFDRQALVLGPTMAWKMRFKSSIGDSEVDTANRGSPKPEVPAEVSINGHTPVQ